MNCNVGGWKQSLCDVIIQWPIEGIEMASNHLGDLEQWPTSKIEDLFFLCAFFSSFVCKFFCYLSFGQK